MNFYVKQQQHQLLHIPYQASQFTDDQMQVDNDNQLTAMWALASWNIQCELLETGFNRFWSRFSQPAPNCADNAELEPAASVSVMRTFAAAFQCLLDCILRHCPRADLPLPTALLRGIRRLLFAPQRLINLEQTRVNFSTYVAHYLDLTFVEQQPSDSDENYNDEAAETRQEARVIADQCSRLLDKLQLRKRILADHKSAFIRRSLALFISRRCGQDFSESHLASVLEFHRRLEDRLNAEFGHKSVSIRKQPLSNRLALSNTNVLPYLVFGETRIRQLFSMTIDYPDSECGLKDLAVCLERLPTLRSKMVRILRADVEQRLLHPGVATPDILSAYIGAVRSLRILDPSGVSQELALGSVAEYLRRREDTIRAIISKMIGDDSGQGGSNDLAAELTRSSPLAGLGEDSAESVDDPGQDFDAWRPDPVEAYSSCGSLSRQPSDLLSLLVGIYGSKRLFINEYQSMLASRLLDSLSFKVDREIKNVELLKLRFGEMDLIKSEVMLKDVEDSRRLCTLISSGSSALGGSRQQQQQQQSFSVSALILSAQFWPAFAPRRMSGLPSQLAAASENFARRFSAQKCNRGLEWRPQLGRVQLRIELAGRELELACKPAQFAILTAFLDRREMSLADVAEAAQLQLSYARRNIGFWVQQGLLAEPRPELFCLLDGSSSTAAASTQSGAASAAVAAADDVEADVDTGGGSDGSEETWECLWNYVVGMLTNMDSCMSVDRIRTMLQLFLVDPSVELDQRKLKAFLDDKVRDGRLTMQGSMYKLA